MCSRHENFTMIDKGVSNKNRNAFAPLTMFEIHQAAEIFIVLSSVSQ